MNTAAHEEGAAVLMAMMAVLLMTAIGTALIVSSSSETVMAAHFQEGVEGRYAAGVMLERGLDDLLERRHGGPGSVSLGGWTAERHPIDLRRIDDRSDGSSQPGELPEECRVLADRYGRGNTGPSVGPG